jgi:TolB protein
MNRLALSLSWALLASLLVTIAIRHQLPEISAADSDETTWGATDPTWSPDGKELAFSLFGSIWRVSRDGGTAVQITDGPGYHAHPAWSPNGEQVAFVSGAPPRGRMPYISGKLVVANIESGGYREIQSGRPLAGTLAWSPDGRKIACALQSPAGGGSLLHEVDVETGKFRPLQVRPQRGPVERWLSVDWNAATGALFFATQRASAPQVWSMSSADKPIMIQLPLTSYRPEDIVLLDSVSSMPDGLSAIYSAVAVNGRGNYELYRVPRTGGDPQAITNTDRDEFAPAVSPDGKWIAHVSNHLGNIDLFLMPVSGGEKKHVQITDLKFRKPLAKVRIHTLDERGDPTPVRLYVRAGDGKAYAPRGAQIFYYTLDPGEGREGFFIAAGDSEIEVPAGNLRLVALKGIEYRILERQVGAVMGKTTEVTLQMSRWTNWADRGWYTGENHFHANYNGSYYQRPVQSLEWLEAEDLNTANMIVANARGAFVHDKEFFTGKVSPISKPRYVLYWGQEYRNSDPLGHMAFLNIKQQVPPSYTSVIGSDSPYDFPLNTMAAMKAREQGGLVSYVHPIGGATRDVFDTNLGAKEAPITAALGAMDAIDVLPFGEAAYELWYRLLNCGFKISPGGGTDTFTNWRGINRIPGGSRQYVEVGSAMNWDRWIERYRDGRAFATNGPLVSFKVDGQPMGSEIRVPAGQTRRVRLEAEITARVPLRTVELIQNGRVIERQEITGNQQTVRVEKTVPVRSSSWFAVRVKGPPARGIGSGFIPRAHSGAIYVLVDGKPVLIREDLHLMLRWIDRLWTYLKERDNFGSSANRSRVVEIFAEARIQYQGKLDSL